jgi:hypothetical protein
MLTVSISHPMISISFDPIRKLQAGKRFATDVDLEHAGCIKLRINFSVSVLVTLFFENPLYLKLHAF